MKLTEIDRRIGGNEPKLIGTVPDYKKAQAYSWYNNYKDSKDLKGYFIKYYENTKGKTKKVDKKLEVLKLSKDTEFQTIGALGRMITNGLIPSDDSIQFIQKTVDRIVEKYSSVMEDKKEDVTLNRPSVQENIREKTRDTIGDLECAIDEFVTGKFSSKFTMNKFITSNNVKKPYLKEIVAYYNKLKDELEQAILKKDEQLNEAYAWIGKRDMKKYLDFVNDIIRESAFKLTEVDTTKKFRKKKPKTPEKLVSRLKFLSEFVDLKLNSIDPTKIIGSSLLVCYNTKNRKISVYNSDSAHGLSVKGSAIINYDKTNSMTFTLRKPEAMLPKFSIPKTRVISNACKEIRGKKSTPNGRINKYTILLCSGK